MSITVAVFISNLEHKEAHNFRISLDEKNKYNLKLLKNTIL